MILLRIGGVLKKKKEYKEVRFSADVLSAAISATEEAARHLKLKLSNKNFEVAHDDSNWEYDHIEEFLAEYRRCNGYAYCWFSFLGEKAHVEITFMVYPRTTTVTVQAPQRVDIERIFSVFEKSVNVSKLKPLPRPPTPAPAAPIVFIGHGRSPVWRDLKDHLHDKHGIKVEAYETGARAGHTIRDILEDMVSKSTFALLVLTAEDEQADGTFRARQNVIHEAGIFQGRLGFSRAILLLEEGVEAFSNVQGVQYIRFSRNNIKETFGEVLATIRREFGA